jgi:hypothetical protein
LPVWRAELAPAELDRLSDLDGGLVADVALVSQGQQDGEIPALAFRMIPDPIRRLFIRRER